MREKKAGTQGRDPSKARDEHVRQGLATINSGEEELKDPSQGGTKKTMGGLDLGSWTEGKRGSKDISVFNLLLLSSKSTLHCLFYEN